MKDWSVDDISHSISEGAGGFVIASYDTDKSLSEDHGGETILGMIEYAKKPGMNVVYVNGDAFNARSLKAQSAKPEGQPGAIDDTDEFSNIPSDLCGVLIFYTGTATEEELIEALIKEFKTQWGYDGSPDEWMEALRWH